ncbi:MAG: SDR family oxidoreductase [Propionivibrio sp.]
MDWFQLKGDVAFVTGAGSGIGQRIAIGLAEAGAAVACFDLKGSPGLATTVESIEKCGVKAIAIEGDVTVADDLAAAIARTEAELGALSVAVNAAGIANATAAEDMPIEQFQRLMKINLEGVFLSCQAEGRAMLKHGRGSIINIASMSGSIVNRGLLQAHYNSSKAAVMHLSKSLAMEWCDRGIRVNSISPGYTLTPMNLRPEVAEQRKIFERDTPIGRMATVERNGRAGHLPVQPRRVVRHRRRSAGRWRLLLLVSHSHRRREKKMEKRFEGKVVVITGGSRGIGKGIAERFVREGAKVCVVANDPLVHETAAELRAQGAQAISAETDVTSSEQVKALYERVAQELGEVNISIQNAGVITVARLEDLTEGEWDKILAVNTKGVYLCCREAALRMRQAGKKGRLINTASTQARQGFIYTPHYAASKFGVIGITQSLAIELAKTGITVNAFCPGIIGTDMWAYNDAAWGKLLGDYQPGELMAEWVEGIPMGRAGTPEDVAGLVTFLASDDAAYITGQTVNVNGGLFMS